MNTGNGFVSLQFEKLTKDQEEERLQNYLDVISTRMTPSAFLPIPVSDEVIEKVIQAAGTAPSGANQQPWTYTIVQQESVRKEVKQLYQEASIKQADLLHSSPKLVIVSKQKYGIQGNDRIKHYYPNESTAISAGFFVAALLHAGLNFLAFPPLKKLKQLIDLPKNEEAFLVFAVGNSGETYTENSLHKAESYYNLIKKRRNVRDFSSQTIDEKLLLMALQSMENNLLSNDSPYHFHLISDPLLKQKIREKAEEEEKTFYEERITEEWRGVLAPLGTNWQKPHLTDAPYLIVAFKVESEKKGTFDAVSSAGVATGVLLSALHHAGLATLTHTPSPMTFLREVLDRPKKETPIVVMPVGYPTDNCLVPNITKKPLQEILKNL
ncbi:nitroreductase family protein [Bacillus sp. 2205SS5-2]|uniref:nitroreductase family protein n=1 Tax=Bacillus sp. 2205SS5-2 TaxID=3109031 RepID=UPI0030059CE2